MRDVLKEIDAVKGSVGNAVDATGRFVRPVRDSLFMRFPIFATLLVAFGVAATFFGMERLITEVAWLNERPLLILLSGIGALVVSGKLYQKLG